MRQVTTIPVLVFARAPVPGAVKTRLIPALGAEAACRLYRKLLRYTLDMATDSRLPVHIWMAASASKTEFEALVGSCQAQLFAQQGADLGERMHHALSRTLSSHPGAVLIGSDCPFLRADDLIRAANLLAEGSDAVLGPALDGGYVLIGVRSSTPALFSGINWGSPEVLASTRQRLTQLGWCWTELEPRQDIDTPSDLASLGPEWGEFGTAR